MRRALLSGSFLVLLAVLCALWAYRYERCAGSRVWRLADLRDAAPPVPGVVWTGAPDQPLIRVRVDPEHPRVAARYMIPGMPAVGMLHLRFRMSARDLTPRGKREDGRIVVEWHSPGAGAGAGWENDPAASIRNNQSTGLQAMVVHPLRAPAVPALRLEHLGRSGEFELADLEITVVRERAVWTIGKWFLAAGWLAWATAWIRSWPGTGRWRALGAAAIWLLMGIHFVIPGPWKNQHPIYPGFLLGEDQAGPVLPDPAAAAVDAAKPPLVIPSGAIPALGKIPVQGSLALRVKDYIAQARPLLHVLLLFAPCLAIAWLVGSRPAWSAGVMLALAIELAQFAFGYGFDWVDGFDLVCDGTGIALALRIYRVSRHRGCWKVARPR